MPQANWYRTNRRSPAPARPLTPRKPHPAALSRGERDRVRTVLNERFADAAPATAYFTLLDEGTYLASTSTMYRILREHGEIGRDRRRHATHPPKTIPELLADAPNRVWAWDITKLRGPGKGVWYHLYTIIDIYSRCVAGWKVASCESAEPVKRLIKATADKQAIDTGTLTLHADRGSSMKSKTVTELLIDLGVAKSHSRPKTSNDNRSTNTRMERTVRGRPRPRGARAPRLGRRSRLRCQCKMVSGPPEVSELGQRQTVQQAGEEEPVLRRERRSGHLPLQDLQLMPQHQNLDLFVKISRGQQSQE
ncbi:DDE-type integrase/transposase/recombinase [Sphaerisporangium perillae]|uniref:DDE-type integrase/transposase/recombinase n=1 Tax=Sphaerisporangium perillae TaxID=2935860 RepID=UPI0020101BD2|nr:DDE-type integrase/transposase/recombinase [Sphaerisporangium perillae]